MITNKPKVMAYLHEPATVQRYVSLTVDRHESGSTAPLIRLSDYERLQAECEKLSKAIRSLCNTYIVDDYYSGDLREERLNRAVERAIDAAMTNTAKPSAEGRG